MISGRQWFLENRRERSDLVGMPVLSRLIEWRKRKMEMQ